MKTTILKMSQFLAMLILATVIVSSCKKDSSPEEENSTNSNYLFQIENGAQTVKLSSNGANRSTESISYSAVLIDKDLNVINVTPTWSADNSDLVSIGSNGLVSINGEGIVNITAKVDYKGASFEATVPLNIQIPTLFAVAPAAVLAYKGDELELNPVYFSTSGQNPTYTYTSSNTAIVSVDANGTIHCLSNGNANITVSSSLEGNPQVVVPVVIVGEPDVALPVTKVTLNKSAIDLLKDETFQFTAKAFNPDGEVTGKTFSWTSENSQIASISNSGLVSPVSPGTTYIKATCDGVFATAEVMVLPDTIVIVSPFYKQIVAGESFQFTAKAYKTSRMGLTQEYAVNFEWLVPDYGAGFEMFNIGTVDQTGTYTMKQDAMIGNASFVIATVPGNISATGASMVMVDTGMGGF